MAWRGWAQRGWGCGQAWTLPVCGGSYEELTAALAPSRLLRRRFNFFIQQKCGFRKAPRKVEPRRSDTSSEAYKRSALIPPVEETAFYPSPYPIRTLVKPLFFTVGFTGCAFGSAAIWQYESLKSKVQSYFDGIKADWLDSIRPQKEGDFRKEINKWWNNLSDGQRTVTDATTLMAESEEELKSLLMKVKEASEKVGVKLNIQKTKIMASGPITSWEIDGETVADFIFLGSKMTSDGDCSHEIKRRLLLGRKVMTRLDSILKSRDITLSTKVPLVKAMDFPIVMYQCESWTIKKAECGRTDAFELWCWRRLLRVSWTARRSNQSILKQISLGCSLERLMLKLKLQYFGHLMRRADSFEKRP